MVNLRKLVISLFLSASITACAATNTRLSTICIDRKDKRDFQIGLGCLGYGGSYSQIGILTLSLDNSWHKKLMPIYNSHTDPEDSEKQKSTFQFGSVVYAEGSCFQLGYLNLRRNENPLYQKISPLIGWHKENPGVCK